MLRRTFTAISSAAFAAGLLAGTASAQAQEAIVFLSTQLRPIDEAQKVRDVLLKGAPRTTYVVDEPSPFTVRMTAEQQAFIEKIAGRPRFVAKAIADMGGRAVMRAKSVADALDAMTAAGYRVLAVASGDKTWAEKWGLHNDLVLFNPAPVT